MKATIVPVTLENLDVVARATKKFGFPRSERWIKRLLFDPNVPEGRDLDSRGALIMSASGECVGVYCWTPCSIYLRQDRKSAYTGALLGVDRKYSPWLFDVIDRSIVEINGRISFGNDVASVKAFKFWTDLGVIWGPEAGAVTDRWVASICGLAFLIGNHILWKVHIKGIRVAKILYWLCVPLHYVVEACLYLRRVWGRKQKWHFKEENSFNEKRFDSFWKRFLAANEGIISSREPRTLSWKFDESLQAGTVALITATRKEGNGELIDGYVLLRRYPINNSSIAEYSICDICAVGNDQKCLNALHRAALRYCHSRRAVRLTYVGAPHDKMSWMVKRFHSTSPLACNPFSYDSKDETILKAVQEDKGWFFGPYDGERCMGCGQYIDL